MIDYLRPIAAATVIQSAQYEVLFKRGEQKNQLWYMNGNDKPHCAHYRPADSINGNALFNALEVILGGLPKGVVHVDVRAETESCKEALKQECSNSQQATIARKTVKFHI